ncbi:hypothetical protein M9458_046689, partial [Cirrhinus mrigala]
FSLPTSAPQTIKDFDVHTYTTSTPTTTTLSTTEVAMTTEVVVMTTLSMTPPTTPEPTAAPTTSLETTTPLHSPPTTPNHATTSSTHPSTATTESTDTTTEATTLSQNASWVEESIQVGLLSTPTSQSYEELVGRSSHEEAAEVTLPALRAGEVVTMGPLIEALPSSSPEVVTLSQSEMDIDALIDTGVPVSSASAPSGDGEAGPDSSDFPLAPDTDYQSDSADLFLL